MPTEVRVHEIVENPNLFHVYHLRRGGGHGVIAWLLAHHSGPKVHYNQCLPTQRPARFWVVDGFIARYAGPAQLPAFELASFEDWPVQRLCEFKRGTVSGALILRDPFNCFASRLQILRHPDSLDPVNRGRGCDIAPNLWKQYAAAFLDPAILPHAVRVNFNQWYTDQPYRRQLSEALGWTFTDTGFGSRAGWQFSRGSSFGDSDPWQLDLLNRWQVFRHDKEFLSLFDQETVELSKSIFGFCPDVLLR